MRFAHRGASRDGGAIARGAIIGAVGAVAARCSFWMSVRRPAYDNHCALAFSMRGMAR